MGASSSFSVNTEFDIYLSYPEKNIYKDHICYTWKCVDKDGDKCMFMMKKFRPEVSSHMLYGILYPENMVMYEYETLQ
jgi:hypothetical protein